MARQAVFGANFMISGRIDIGQKKWISGAILAVLTVVWPKKKKKEVNKKSIRPRKNLKIPSPKVGCIEFFIYPPVAYITFI